MYYQNRVSISTALRDCVLAPNSFKRGVAIERLKDAVSVVLTIGAFAAIGVMFAWRG